MIVTAIRRKSNTISKKKSAPVINAYAVSEIHEEKDILTDLESHLVEQPFAEAFTESPLEVTFDVYKMTLQPDNTYRRDEVPWGYVDALQPTATGFSIQINEMFTPDLTGVIIKYKFEPV